MLSRLVRMTRNEEGFTLIELLVVVAIIALLTAFAVPKLFEAINKSKSARGAGDIEVISGALERYYMDKSQYPTANLETSLKGDYVKNGTKFLNGYGLGYLYVTDADGTYHVFADPASETGAVTIKCGAWESNAITPIKTGVATGTMDPGPDSDEMAAGCKVMSGTTEVPESRVVTN